MPAALADVATVSQYNVLNSIKINKPRLKRGYFLQLVLGTAFFKCSSLNLENLC